MERIWLSSTLTSSLFWQLRGRSLLWQWVCACVYFLVFCTVGTSVLLCWPSARNEKCLMPLVCSEGLSLFRRWTAMHYWLQNTIAMLFHLSTQLTVNRGLFFFWTGLVCINLSTMLTDCMFCVCDVFLLHSPPTPFTFCFLWHPVGG